MRLKEKGRGLEIEKNYENGCFDVFVQEIKEADDHCVKAYLERERLRLQREREELERLAREKREAEERIKKEKEEAKLLKA